jgi:hypothetical protein
MKYTFYVDPWSIQGGHYLEEGPSSVFPYLI